MAQTILLQNARLIDGIADQPRERVSILTTGERIDKVELRHCLHRLTRRSSIWGEKRFFLV